MLYNVDLKNKIVDTLEDRVLTIVSVCIALTNEGYAPNKNKMVKLQWSSILIDAFDNINILNINQRKNIENIYNKVMAL